MRSLNCRPSAGRQPSPLYQFRRRPLKIGINQDIVAALDGAITAEELKLGLSRYCSNIGYPRACREGTPRIDLNGNAVGAVTAEQAARAAATRFVLGHRSASSLIQRSREAAAGLMVHRPVAGVKVLEDALAHHTALLGSAGSAQRADD
jgi:sRNA-binding protein